MTIDRARDARGPWGPLAGAAIGAAFFAWIAGTRILDPGSIDWLMKGDWVPHYFGWHYFRDEPWHWPPGAVHGYYAPLGTSIGLTDSIPLVGYALKPFAAWLPTPFQYLGPFLLACFALQGALGARLIARRVDAVGAQVLGAALFVLLPALLLRVGHAALCAHWLILWALLVATREPSARFRPGSWAVLGLTAGMVQPYLAAMVLAVLGATAVAAEGPPVHRRFAALGAALAATISGWWISGLFLLSGGSSLAAGGLGYYSMNLLAFVSPGDWSSFLPALPIASDGQAYEGFQYLGLGILLVLAAALAIAARDRTPQGPAREPRLWSPWLIAACLVMTAFAVSPVVTLGSRTILNLDGPWTAPLALFRSSGRFVWPLVYLMLTSAIVTVVRRGRGPTGVAVLAAAVVLQLVDLHGAHTFRRQVAHDPAFHAWVNPFADARWHDVAPAYAHLALVPPPQCGASPIPYEGAIALTARHGLTINAGVVARRDERAREGYCRALDADIDAVRLRDDTLYVVTPAAVGVLTRMGEGRVTCGAIGGVSVCTTPAAHARWADRARLD
ncbi:MAG: hypothetical protein JNL48_07130 [Acidobacteria bacterium]|nr:hypothetical protein [Acidobacteriota bacterium]